MPATLAASLIPADLTDPHAPGLASAAIDQLLDRYRAELEDAAGDADTEDGETEYVRQLRSTRDSIGAAANDLFYLLLQASNQLRRHRQHTGQDDTETAA